MDCSYKEKEEWESCLPEDRLSGLFVTAELKTGDRGREESGDCCFFKEIGFLFKGSAQPKHKKDVFFLPLTCNGIQPGGKFCFYSVLCLRYSRKIQYNGDDYNFVWGARHIENIRCRNSALIALNDPRPCLWTVFTGTTSTIESPILWSYVYTGQRCSSLFTSSAGTASSVPFYVACWKVTLWMYRSWSTSDKVGDQSSCPVHSFSALSSSLSHRDQVKLHQSKIINKW